MWLYSVSLLAAFTYLACTTNSTVNSKKRNKQDDNHAMATNNYRRRYRLLSDDTNDMQVPLKIPKLSKAQKIALIIESGQDPFEKKRKRKEKGRKRLRKLRHVRRYPGNAYLLLDDNDGIESYLNVERALTEGRYNDALEYQRRQQQQKQQQQQESDDRFDRHWEAEIETTTARTVAEIDWDAINEPYDWRSSTTTTGYWDETTTEPYWKTETIAATTPSYWDSSISDLWQTSLWQRIDETIRPSATTTISSMIPSTEDASSIQDSESDAAIWGRFPAETPTVSTTSVSTTKSLQPLALPIKNCPHRFDAVTRAFNGRTYVFARDRVYQLWRHDNLHQKASFLVNEMFPDGPRTVTVAYTNNRSGVTVLIEHQTVYRYRWNRKNKVFYLARKSPQILTKKMPVYPRAGFQWIDGNQVLVEGDNFATYDAYWNVATFFGLTSNYFPQFPRDLIGLTYQNNTLFILYTASNKIQIYDTGKYRVIQEYPIQISEFVGCLNG